MIGISVDQRVIFSFNKQDAGFSGPVKVLRAGYLLKVVRDVSSGPK